MAKKLAVVEDAPDSGESWGEANEQRGKSHLQLSIDFVKAFPIGTPLDAKDFDEWAEKNGLLTLPSADVSKQSDAWKAHLMRRHELRYRINRSGSHPRLRDHGSTPFTLDTVRSGLYEVRAPHTSVAQSQMPARIASYMETKRKHLAYLMQSADWNRLPAYERVVAETIYDDIDGFTDNIHAQANRITNKLSKLESRLKRAVEIGQITPSNNGITKLLSSETPESDDIIDG